MKRFIPFLVFLLIFCGCGKTEPNTGDGTAMETSAISIHLDERGITVDDAEISHDSSQAVYVANDIVYYPTGKDFTFGEGTETDAHESAEADSHRVIHITKAGTYRLSGKLSAGQIAVDLGSDAKKNPDAVVNLVLDNADITCTVAPAVIFYNVYECGDKENPSAQVDTSAAGANVFLADNSVNSVQGSYVARIYKPDSVELTEDGTAVADAKKLHKYDAAFYSKMSMNIYGSNGILDIQAENEGLDSEMHLTIHGGDIRINSGNDGINTNEDGVSVTTINGGSLVINVNGSTGEGDGIDSNGWLVVNGGYVMASACSFSMDSGIDSDMGIHINGGTVIATGNMLDRISASKQNHAVFNFAEGQNGGSEYRFTDGGKVNLSFSPVNGFSTLIISTPDLAFGDYSFFCGDTQLAHSDAQGSFYRPGGMMPPEGFTFPDRGMIPPEGMEFPQGGMMPPEGTEFPQGGMMPPKGTEFPQGGMMPPEGTEFPQGGMIPPMGTEFPQNGMTPPDGMEFPQGFRDNGLIDNPVAQNPVFTLTESATAFYNVSHYQA